ncbi:MAG: hypothetical protein BZY75_01055 [SAR202 cluster bacterium Io17-Chloro-G7]|nr:MAG: hypothetical protein BZY75_01055 [SAR202 cluster bacterium Io17-Chloro-G7]
MTLRVARVPYLNAEAFYVDMERRGLSLHEILPSAVASAILEREIDAGPVPLVDAFRHADETKPVSGFCIATTEKAMSVLLYSQKPIEELVGANIGLPDGAETSHRLLQVLLALKYQVKPGEYVPMSDPHEAFLIADDPALRRRLGVRGFPHRYDLGAEWFQWTGLPFVFSRWIARSDLNDADSLLLEDTLYVGLEMGIENLFHETDPRDRLLMLPKEVVEYIQGHRFFVGLSERKAIELFQSYLKQLNLEN